MFGVLRFPALVKAFVNKVFVSSKDAEDEDPKDNDENGVNKIMNDRNLPAFDVVVAVSLLELFLIFRFTGDTRSLDIIPKAFLIDSIDSRSFFLLVAGRDNFEAGGCDLGMGMLDCARPNFPDPEDGTGIPEDAAALLFLVLGGILI